MVGHFDSIILRTCARLLLPILAMVSVFFFFRGHNQPGGGFIAGLILSAGFLIHALAFGIEGARRIAPTALPIVYGAGWLLAVGSAIVPLFFGANFLASAHVHLPLGPLGEVHVVGSTAFDTGVYLIVVGVVVDLILRIAEEPAPRGEHA